MSKQVQQVEQLSIGCKLCPAENKTKLCIKDCCSCEYYQQWVEKFAEELEDARENYRK